MMKGAVLFEIPSQEVKAKRLKANRKDYQSTSANTLQGDSFDFSVSCQQMKGKTNSSPSNTAECAATV